MLKFKVENGFCPICREQFFDICLACKRPGKAMANHRQFKATLSNGNQAWLGVCDKDLPNMTLALANAIWAGIVEWESDLGVDYSGVEVVGFELEAVK